MSQRIGNLPANINIMNPVPNKDAKTIMKLIRTNGKISGYQLSDGTVLSKADGVALAKQGGIRGVAIASRNGSDYLRGIPDGKESYPYFCLFCVFERFTVNLYSVFGNGDAVKRLCRSTNFGFIQCVRPCSHAQNCIFHIFRVTHIAKLGAVIVQKALRAFAPCRNHRHAGRECFHGRNAERLNIRSHQKGVGLA